MNGGIGTNFIKPSAPSDTMMQQAAADVAYKNPWYVRFWRNRGRLPSIFWAEGNGTTHITQLPQVNTGRGPTPFWQTHSVWAPTRNWRPIQFAPKMGAKSSLTSYGFPSTWFTLHLPLAQPDLQTALSRRYRPVIQKFQASGGASYRIPGVFVPIRPTGPGNFTGGQGSTQG
jgi:hypothetical protein